MKYKIITDRFEIEKMAEDSYFSGDISTIHVDYADLSTLKRWGTFKYAIVCDFDTANNDWFEEFKDVIKSIQLPLNNLKAFFLNVLEGGNEKDASLSYADYIKLQDYFITIRCSEECPADIPDNYTTCLVALKSRATLPKGALQIQLMSTYEKTEQDKQEDEKYEQMIEEYRNTVLRPDYSPKFIGILDYD